MESFFVTSDTRHILSRGSSLSLAVFCMIAVRNDWGLKKPDSHTDVGKMKSDVQACSSMILNKRSAYQADSPFRDLKASFAQVAGT